VKFVVLAAFICNAAALCSEFHGDDCLGNCGCGICNLTTHEVCLDDKGACLQLDGDWKPASDTEKCHNLMIVVWVLVGVVGFTSVALILLLVGCKFWSYFKSFSQFEVQPLIR